MVAPEDPLEGCDQPAVLGTTLLHSKRVQHLSGALECDPWSLLSDSEHRQKDRDQPVLAPRQSIARMSGDLEHELTVAAFME
jgi:hypothetical protein